MTEIIQKLNQDDFLDNDTMHPNDGLAEDEKRKIICDQCSRPFKDTHSLNRHVANVHADEKRFKCELCNKGFGVKGNYNAHMAKVHQGDANCACEFCGKVLSDIKSLRSHVMSKHKRDECPHECEICQKKFSRSSYLCRHVLDVHKNEKAINGKLLQCDKCEEFFKFKVLLEDHMKKKHHFEVLSKPTKKVSCEFCGRSVLDRKALRLHILSKHKRDECRHECQFCGKKFPRQSVLQRHVKTHKGHESAPPQIDEKNEEIVVKQETEDIDEQMIHEFSGETNEDDFPAAAAAEFSVKTNDVKVEPTDMVECKIKEEEVDIADLIHCQDCSTAFDHLDEYEAHQCFVSSAGLQQEESRQDGLLFQCEKCDKRYPRKDSLRRHRREVHSSAAIPKVRGQGHTCHLCGINFDQGYLYRLHMTKAHNEVLEKESEEHQPNADEDASNKHKCNFCEKRFCRKESVRRHIREAHEGKKKKDEGIVYECDQCEKRYDRRDVLRRHIRLVHEAVQAGNCDLCGGAFFRDISRHMIVSHTNGNNEVECPICNKSIGKNYSLKRHIRVFHEEQDELRKPHKPYKIRTKLCDICGQPFETESALTIHRKDAHNLEPVSHKAKRLPCPHCDKTICGKNGLRVHIKTVHEKRRDFMCNQCGRCFTQLISLQAHVKHIHFGVERSFPCKHCSKIFTNPRSRQLHVEKLHKTLQCIKCNQMFALRKHLAQHVCDQDDDDPASKKPPLLSDDVFVDSE